MDRSTKLTCLSCLTALAGCLFSLYLPWARLGQQGQSWSLIEDCPICVVAARFIEPIGQIGNASKTAVGMVYASASCAAACVLIIAQTKKNSRAAQGFSLLSGALLAFAPMVFLLMIPNSIPVHLGVAGYGAVGFGTAALVCAVAALNEAQRYSVVDVRDGWAATAAADRPVPLATYGATNKV